VTEVTLGPGRLLAGALSVVFQPILELRGERRRLHSLEALVLESVARLGPRLEARVVAEGIESQAELWTVAALGIDLVQGFLLSPPLPSGEVPPGGWSPLLGSAGGTEDGVADGPRGFAAREVHA